MKKLILLPILAFLTLEAQNFSGSWGYKIDREEITVYGDKIQNQNNGGGGGGNTIITQGLQQARQPTQAQNMVNSINGGAGQSFDQMYGGPQNPLVNAQLPQDNLMAANEVLGGSFGTAF